MSSVREKKVLKACILHRFISFRTQDIAEVVFSRLNFSEIGMEGKQKYFRFKKQNGKGERKLGKKTFSSPWQQHPEI